jgi:hypothetical protein
MGSPRQGADQTGDKPTTPRHVAMNWAQRLKRVFGVEIEHCTGCGGKLAIIASIEEPQGRRSSRRFWRTCRSQPWITINPSCRSAHGHRPYRCG